jgi:hypothetical protein
MTESIRVTVGEALVRFLIAPSTTVNDALKPVTRYWDRIASPTQILSALPNAVVVLLSPSAWFTKPRDIGPRWLKSKRQLQ